MYKQFLNFQNELDDGIIRLTDNAFIPPDPDNTDYQEYLAWVAEGNEPLPADSE